MEIDAKEVQNDDNIMALSNDLGELEIENNEEVSTDGLTFQN